MSYSVISETSRNCHVDTIFGHNKHVFPIFPGTLSTCIPLSFLPTTVLSHKHTKSHCITHLRGRSPFYLEKGGKKPPHQLSDLIKITQHAATEVGLSTASFSLPVNPAENNSEIQKQRETVPNNNRCFIENSFSLTLYKN